MHPQEVWEGSGGKARLLRGVLTPLSWLYAFGWQVYLLAYASGFKRPAEPHRRIVCVGGLVVGGSGKSPLTLDLASVLIEMGKQVVIGCSGYGAPHAHSAAIAPSGSLKASEWGDEPAMFRWLMPDVPLVVGRDRVQAARLVHEAFPDAVLLMDDGFQHLPIKKHLTILIDDPQPVNARCLPAGPFREPRFNRRRADLVVPGRFTIHRDPMRLVTPEGKDEAPAEYAVLCALGQPDRFLAALAVQFPNRRVDTPAAILGDHDPLTSDGLWAHLPANLPIVVTAKDWVKLRERSDVADRNFRIALQDVRLEPREEFKKWVETSLNE